MEVKKTEKANLENRRLLFTEIGLAFLGSFGTALVSFSPHLLQVLVSLPSAVVVAAAVVIPL